MKKIRATKGIKLVALVLTIIIMLILAGVAISVVAGEGGLIDKATTAADKYNNAAKNEGEQIQGILNLLDGYGAGGNQIFTPVTDGSYDSIKKVNTPNLMAGMTAIYWDNNGVEQTLNKTTSTETE